MKILYQSSDSGALYDEVDDPNQFVQIEVPNEIILTPEQICGRYGNIVEILLAAKQAKVIN